MIWVIGGIAYLIFALVIWALMRAASEVDEQSEAYARRFHEDE